MTTTPPEAPAGPPPAQPGPRVTRGEVRDLSRLRRTAGPDRKIAGVAGGLARHLDVDPILLRVALVVLVFFGGAGILVYVACWLLVPRDGSDRAVVTLDARNRTYALVGAGALALFAMLADSFGQWGFPWPLVGIAVIALLVLTVLDRGRGPAAAPPYPPHPAYQYPQPDPQPGTTYSAMSGAAWAPPAPDAPYASYQPASYQPPSYQPAPIPSVPPTYYRPVPRNPRKRGPILFWFTMALSALAIGVLGILNLAGAAIADSAYPAAVVAACGVMLLVGAFWGRAGGLILVGLVASLGVAGATAAEDIDGGDIVRTPTTAAAVPDRLDTSAGEIVLDLTRVQDLAALDGRDLSLRSDLGRVEVIVPAGLSVSVDAEVSTGGQIELFGSERGGFGIADTDRHDGGSGAPEITIEADVSLGEIQVHEGASR